MDWELFQEKFLSFQGRLNRWPFFWQQVLFSVGLTCFSLVNASIVLPIMPPLAGAVQLILAVLNIAVIISFGVRRCHDLDLSGAWVVLDCIPLVNIFFILYLLLKKGTDGSNRYGPDPLAQEDY